LSLNRVILRPFYSMMFLTNRTRLSDLPKSDFDLIAEQLNRIGVEILEYEVPTSCFHRYIEEANYPKFYIEDIERRRKGRFRAKALEHYVGDNFLNFQNGDVYVDIAGSSSPYVDIVDRSHKGVKGYILDFVFKKGIFGNRIGADATNTGLPDKFCS